MILLVCFVEDKHGERRTYIAGTFTDMRKMEFAKNVYRKSFEDFSVSFSENKMRKNQIIGPSGEKI